MPADMPNAYADYINTCPLTASPAYKLADKSEVLYHRATTRGRRRDCFEMRHTIHLPLVFFAAVSVAHAEGMCRVDEKVLFNCDLNKTRASLCQSSDKTTLTYRNGTKQKLDMELSDAGSQHGNIFYFSNVPYAGGGEAHVRFSRDNYTYYLYDKTVRAADGPSFSAGIVVFKGSKKISNPVCTNDASIHQEAYQDIRKEEYRDIDSR